GKNAAEVLERLASVDPTPVRTLNPSVPPALDAVCRKAMARNPTERYASAEEVATDVRRWQADEPVTAYREPFSARAARWARRHRTPVIAAAVLLLTAAIASSAAAAMVWREQQQTKFGWKQAEAKQIQATENANAAIHVVRDLHEYVEKVEFSGRQAVITDVQRKSYLDKSLASYEHLLALQPDAADVRSSVARIHRFRANVCRLLNQLADAELSYREAIRHHDMYRGQFPDDVCYRRQAAETSRDFGLLLKRTGRLRDTTVRVDEAIRIFRDLLASRPEELANQRVLANILIDRAELDYDLGNYSESEQTARTAAGLYAKVMETPGI